MPTDPKVLDTLQSVFGHSAFRGDQEQVVQNLLQGQDVVVLMPTGGGKSLCYQLPSLLRFGTGIVISPLIALMQDQVAALQQLGVRAAYLNSSLSFEEVQQVESQFLSQQLDLLYVAPERLLMPRFLNMLTQVPIALFAIDEAHCVSQWGHDFRPEYRQITVLHEHFPNVPRIALTATADRVTRNDIIHHLQLQQAQVFVSSFDRPNIRYQVVLKDNAKKQLLHFMNTEHPDDAGVVYCLSRKKVEQTAEWLCAQGRKALPYHAGLEPQVRQEHQDRFLKEEGLVIVATIAFGMGIDKSNVRFVAHLDLPKSMEAYYQETGRAGRDGLPANAWMTYSLSDVVALKRIIMGSEADDHYKRLELQKLNALLGYCESIQCRRQVLLRYFDDHYPKPCGNCDTCLTPVESFDGTLLAQKALSCVYRTQQRFGAAHMVSILLGKETSKVKDLRHDQLSTFGIGKELDERQWSSVFRQLVAAEYLTADLDGYGSLLLTQKSQALLKGETSLQLRKDPEPPPKNKLKKRRSVSSAKPKSFVQFDDPAQTELWQALRQHRLDLAHDQGVPPYIIFHDDTLLAMLKTQPQTLEDMSHIPGVGAKKLESYGESFLKVLQQNPIPPFSSVNSHLAEV